MFRSPIKVRVRATYLMTLLLLFLLCTFTNATPIVTNSRATALCDAKVFDIPWMLTQLTLYTPPANATNSSPSSSGWLRFNFIDSNDRLGLETVCYGDLADDGTAAPTDGGYTLCTSSDVAFKLVSAGPEGKGRVMMVERLYKDHCLGPPPYNYGFAYGQSEVPVVAALPSTAGTLRIIDAVLVNITAMS